MQGNIINLHMVLMSLIAQMLQMHQIKITELFLNRFYLWESFHYSSGL